MKVKETLSVFLFFFRKALFLSFSTISQPFFLARENLSSFPLVGRCCRGTFGGASLLRTQLCQHAHGFQSRLAQKRNPLRSHSRRSGTQTSSAATLKPHRFFSLEEILPLIKPNIFRTFNFQFIRHETKNLSLLSSSPCRDGL